PLQTPQARSTISAFRDSQHKGRWHASFSAQAHLPAAFAVFKGKFQLSVLSIASKESLRTTLRALTVVLRVRLNSSIAELILLPSTRLERKNHCTSPVPVSPLGEGAQCPLVRRVRTRYFSFSGFCGSDEEALMTNSSGKGEVEPAMGEAY